MRLQKKKIATNFLKVREIAKEVADDLVIAYGAEIYYTPDVLEKLENKRIPTLNDSRYALRQKSCKSLSKEPIRVRELRQLCLQHYQQKRRFS